jgi:hypothetical protein
MKSVDSELPGGYADAGVDIYDPGTNRFASGHMVGSRYLHTATLLPDGRVLLAGGDYSSAAEIYSPAVLVPSPVLYSVPGGMQGAIWHVTTGEIASSSNPAVAGEVLAMYTKNLIERGSNPSTGDRWWAQRIGPLFRRRARISRRIPGELPGAERRRNRIRYDSSLELHRAPEQRGYHRITVDVGG